MSPLEWKRRPDSGHFQLVPSRPPSSTGLPVFLHVYSLLPPSALSLMVSSLGVGVYHTGVEIRGKEYCFGAHPYNFSGIFSVKPKIGPKGVRYKKSILMGYCQLNDTEINRVLHRLAQSFTGMSYHLLERNCNHFSSDLCEQLVGVAIPDWVNRAARVASCFPFLIPAEFINPPVFEQENMVTSEKRKSWRRSWVR
ncbi:uncharacterized protein VTP21DRAFT_3902 [Calcarisporiella thermophila]|uniref:uncharacterized protein n=1 Tax=Calcarisporiella thermophila TaxID=911321 RepID=UPI0037447B42